ncbi:hypothetical protein JW890_08695 [candidate division WOR-3 bacterium]|nr:hypothetical protein [candidate division WOR-3 bacterium]
MRASVGRFDMLELNAPARESLSRIADGSAVEFLKGKIKDASAREFLTIVEIFKLMKDEGRAAVLDLMASSDADIRSSALYIAGEMNDSMLLSRASDLTWDTSWRVRANTARILGTDSNGLFLQELRILMLDTIPSVRLNALVSLEKIQKLPPELLEDVSLLLGDSNLFIREKALDVLLKDDSSSFEILFKRKDSIPILVTALFFVRSSHPGSCLELRKILDTADEDTKKAVFINLLFYSPSRVDSLESNFSELFQAVFLEGAK